MNAQRRLSSRKPSVQTHAVDRHTRSAGFTLVELLGCDYHHRNSCWHRSARHFLGGQHRQINCNEDGTQFAGNGRTEVSGEVR